MNHFLASYSDALSRSDSGVLIENDNTLYCALPSLDSQVINSWIELQKFLFPNLKICGVYSTQEINLLDYDFLLLDKLIFANYDNIYNVYWLDEQEKELGYYTCQKYKISLEYSLEKYEKKFNLANLGVSEILANLDKIDSDAPSTRFLLNSLSRLDLKENHIKDFSSLVQSVVKKTRMEGLNSF